MTTALPTSPSARRFRWLALSAAVTTFGLIVLGGIVRVTGSGMGCGDHWPLCNGQLFPPLDLPTFIELSHRLVTTLVTPLVLAVAFFAWRSFRRVRWIMAPALWAVALLVIQILLGAITVKLELPPAVVALHLANAQALLALLLVITVVAFQYDQDPRVGESLLHFDALSRLAGAAALGVYVLIITGALVTAGRAAASCVGWPLCNGALTPTSAAGWLHMGHRYVAGAVGLMVIGAVLQAWRLRRADAPVFVAAGATGALFLAQIFVGAFNVLRAFPTFLNGLHIATASAVWAGMVVFAVLAMQAVRRSPLKFAVPAQQRRGWRAVVADYFLLTKPIIVGLLLVTTAAAMVVAGHGWPPADLFWWTMLGGGLAAGGAGALNQVIDRHLDQHMSRTSRRPIAAGRVDTAGGLAFGLALSVASFYVLAVFVTPLAALLALFGNLYYVVGYSLLLKQSTVQNIVIGGGAGAVPPLVGWAAATGRLNMEALFLFALIFFWTPPHFWALALLKKNDYARAQVPMLPVLWGEDETRRHIVLYTLLMVALSLLLTPAGVAGWFYLLAAALLGAGFLFFAVWLWRRQGNKPAWRLYKYSSVYLALIFAALVVDRLITGN
ncbi:MAG: protoheme IX farnesyltransferase [Anaerolineales bacterium]|nr:protoheme IX farnesyltransferase [Anaerolineales bacterium]